jgi:hypothetical protein
MPPFHSLTSAHYPLLPAVSPNPNSHCGSAHRNPRHPRSSAATFLPSTRTFFPKSVCLRQNSCPLSRSVCDLPDRQPNTPARDSVPRNRTPSSWISRNFAAKALITNATVSLVTRTQIMADKTDQGYFTDEDQLGDVLVGKERPQSTNQAYAHELLDYWGRQIQSAITTCRSRIFASATTASWLRSRRGRLFFIAPQPASCWLARPGQRQPSGRCRLSSSLRGPA